MQSDMAATTQVPLPPPATPPVVGVSPLPPKSPALALVLSLFPGIGQIYNGRVFVGIIWLILTGFSWIGSAGLLGWVFHLIAGWCAYSYAKEHPVRT